MAAYGEWTGAKLTQNVKYRACIDFRTGLQGEDSAEVEVRRWVEVEGDFRGTILDTSWAGRVSLDGAGTYADSGWVTHSTTAYGEADHTSAVASYTGGSGTVYTSTATLWYVPVPPEWEPRAPGAPVPGAWSAGSVALAWERAAKASRPYASQEVQRSMDGGAWEAAASLGGDASSWTDAGASAGHSWRWRVVASNASGSAASEASQARLAAPLAPSSVAASLASATSARVSWASANAAGVASSWELQRSADGGSWASAGTASGAATSVSEAVSDGHSYVWRVRASNGSGTSAWAESAALVTAPAAPTVASVARSSDTAVAVALAGWDSPATTGLELQRQPYGSDAWAAAWSGAPAAALADEPGAGVWRYRVRATGPGGTSAWSEASAWVASMAPPNAPTITAPASGSMHAGGTGLALSWRHNPADGSAQTAAEAQWSSDGGSTWQSASVAGAGTSVSVPLPASADVTARVRTAGASGDFGPWASVSFKARRAPQVAVSVAPTVREVPFRVSWDPGPADGSVASATLEVFRAGSASPAFAVTLKAGTLAYDVAKSDLVPEDGASYEARVSLRMGTGLSGSGSAAFAVDYEAPGAPLLEVEVDGGRCLAVATVRFGQAPVPTESVSVWAGELLVAEGLASGESCTCLMPPLDVEIPFRAVAFAPSGASSTTTVPRTVPSRSFAVVNFGEGGRDVARVGANLVAESTSKPERETLKACGRTLPVSMYGEHVDLTGSLEGDVWWLEDFAGWGEEASLAAWGRLAGWIGDSWLRLPHGEGPDRVAMDVSLSRDASVWGVAGVSASWTGVSE